VENLFAASYMKLGRAEQFIDELNQEFEKFAKAQTPVTISLSPDGTLTAEGMTEGYGLKPGAIIGDAIHNMRTALDLLASDLARLKGKSPNDVYFPFCSPKEKLDEMISKKHFDKCGADAVDLLRKLEPWPGGKSKLRELHDMDIRDKHTALIVTSIHAEISLDFTKIDLEKDASILGHTTIVFPEGHALEGASVIDALKDFHQLLHSVLKAFADMVAARAL
jgi:hypothetical protein